MIAALITAVASWRRYRTAVRQLADLDDRSLRDIGLSRTDIKRAAWHGSRR
jgi:uncharacterized protein YjiS (DUF1127 family)